MLELFKELDRCVASPVRNLHELEGDMYMSDTYYKLKQKDKDNAKDKATTDNG